MSATGTVRDYYAILRAGEPLAPFFAERADLVKFGITERLEGHEAVAAGLREQTAATEDWTVESADLRVAQQGDAAWFTDEVFLAWTRDGERYEYDSRWSGTLLRRDDTAGDVGDGDVSDDGDGDDGNGDDGDDDDGDDGEWQFVGMHVSVAH